MPANTHSNPWQNRLPLVLGGILMLAGAILGGKVILENFVSDEGAAQVAEQAAADLRNQWSLEPGTAAPVGDYSDISTVEMNRPLGKGFAIIYIPRLGDKWRAVVVEGVQDEDLLGTVGHFKKSADPGMVGNFAMAAHRLTRGSLFRYLDEVKDGDKIIIETATHWYVYTVTGSKIIKPTDVDVIAPVPFHPGRKATKAAITLTTCNPWWNSSQRLAVFGDLTEARLKPMGPPASMPPAALT